MNVIDRALDRSVVFSFDRTGFFRHRRRFLAEDLQVDLRGRTVAVTGANAGLGRAAAESLHELGANVWLICRDGDRGRAALDALKAKPGGDPQLVRGDLSDLESVRRVADALPASLAVLVHNAGVLPRAFQRTADGLELTWATNVVGPFLLTQLVLPRLREQADARVITVASGGLYGVSLDVEVARRAAAPEGSGRFDGVRQYAFTKRAQLALSDRLAVREPQVRLHTMHPGWADTGGVRRSLPTFRAVTRPILRTPEQGADTIVWLAAVAAARLEPATGGFWFDRAVAPRHLLTSTARGDRDVDVLLGLVRAQAGLQSG